MNGFVAEFSPIVEKFIDHFSNGCGSVRETHADSFIFLGGEKLTQILGN